MSQVDAALELATQMLQTAADIAVESKCNFSVAISVYTSQMHCDADDQGTSKIFSGRAIAKAVEFPGYPGCVSADKDVHDLAVVSALSWPFISIVEDEHGSEAVCILQEGNWAEAQVTWPSCLLCPASAN